jgi:hypothetical protein
MQQTHLARACSSMVGEARGSEQCHRHTRRVLRPAGGIPPYSQYGGQRLQLWLSALSLSWSRSVVVGKPPTGSAQGQAVTGETKVNRPCLLLRVEVTSGGRRLSCARTHRRQRCGIPCGSVSGHSWAIRLFPARAWMGTSGHKFRCATGHFGLLGRRGAHFQTGGMRHRPAGRVAASVGRPSSARRISDARR